MVRKRLSDLLKEEAQKSLPPDADPAASEPLDVQAAAPSPSPAPRAARRSSASAKTESAKTESAKVESAKTQSAKTENAKAESAKADEAAAAEITALQATVAELNAALAAAQQREDAFQQQIIDLKSALTGQAVHIQTLEAELAQSQSLKAELEHAKKHILQLSEATLRGNPAIASAPVSTPVSAPGAPSRPAPALALSPPPSAASLAARGASRHEQELAKILQHPILPKPVSNGKTSDEMGWFD